jgi:GT2 family glycosyltransferase
MNNDGHVKIIISSTNGGEWLRMTVDSILQHTDYPSYEIVVSASVDQITDFSFIDGPAYGRVTLLRTKKTLGSGSVRNVAAQPGDAIYYVFLDSHCLVEQRDWLRRATESLERYPNASMIQPETVAFAHESGLAPRDNVTISKLPLLRYEYGAKWAWPYLSPWSLVESLAMKFVPDLFEAMSGAGMAGFTRSVVFHRLGKFDHEVNGWFHETMDYCVRAWMLGHPMMVEPSIRIYHRDSLKPTDQPRTVLSLIHGTIRTAYKYLSPRRRDLAEILFRKHGFDNEVDAALGMIRRGRWLSERVEHLRNRVHDDDWLFSKFEVYEERYAGQRGPAASNQAPSASNR